MALIAHAVFHLTMCASIAKLPANTPVDIAIHAVDETGRQKYDENFRFERGMSDVHSVDFDTPRGTFKILVSAPKYNCSGGDYYMFITDHTRNINMTLAEGPPDFGKPFLVGGTAPESFSYANPTFVLLDKSVVCDKPIGDPIPLTIRTEAESDGYYLWLYSTPDLVKRGNVQLALQLGSSTGENHYVRLRFPFPQPWDGWPISLQFDLPDNIFDVLAPKPADTLICLPLRRTSAG